MTCINAPDGHRAPTAALEAVTCLAGPPTPGAESGPQCGAGHAPNSWHRPAMTQELRTGPSAPHSHRRTVTCGAEWLCGPGNGAEIREIQPRSQTPLGRGKESKIFKTSAMETSSATEHPVCRRSTRSWRVAKMVARSAWFA